MGAVGVSVTRPSLWKSDTATPPRAVILMLHGGLDRSREVVDGRSLSWRRFRLMQRSISRGAHAEGVSTWLLRYRHRGWNGGDGPVEDARWALAEVRRELGELPVVLLGHSMGARTSIHAVDHDSVVGVVGLAPWFPPEDRVAGLTGRHLLAAHGHRDRITSYRATAAFVERARDVTSSAELRDMGPVGHYMLRRPRSWNDVALSGALDMLPA
jgi:alpha-beta hydrolase superfamily lysophospholipase